MFLDEHSLKAKNGDNAIIINQDALYLFEWQEYMVIGKRSFTLRIGDKTFESEEISNNTYIATFQFKNYIGKAKIEIQEIQESTKPISLDFEVLSKKVDKIYKDTGDIVEKHRRLYKVLVGYISKELVSLPFSIGTPTAFGVEESEEPINELFAYHYLRSENERIIEAFETVMHRMKRELVMDEEWLRPNKIDEITPETLLSIAQHPEYLAPAGDGVFIATYLNGYVPTRVLGLRKYESFDTPENRFVKHFLNLLVEWSERVVETFNEKDADLEPIRELLEELEFIRSDSVWEEIGDMALFPYTSQTLLKGDGYRDLLELYREFTAYSPFFEGLQKAIDNRDIAKLYEYWAFFRLVEELGRVLGKKDIRIVVTPAGELSESGDVYAQFDNGWRLYYNKKLIPRKWSYSVTLRPDFSLFTGDPDETGTELVGVFDAKFKLDVVDANKFAEEDRKMEKEPSLQTWAKLEDIYKMHTYRDALGCNFAVVLYPGQRSVFFDTNKGRLSGSFDFSSLLSRDLKGVGYIRLMPEVER